MINRIINKYKYWEELLNRRHLLKNFCSGHQVRLYNWTKPFAQDMWLIDFIEKRGLLKNKPKARIGLYSIFGPSHYIGWERSDARLFVERENLHKPMMQGWLHRYLDDPRIDLSLGFDEMSSDGYMRFPFWVMWSVFSPTATFDEIKGEIDRMNSPQNHSYDDRKYCAYVCGHDDFGRRKMYKQFSTIGRVDCDGRLFHNNDDLLNLYNDDKIEYLKHYRFNLTPENTNYKDYVTEKLFEAISAGAIPIYHGSDNCPEPDILNHDAIVFIEVGADNKEAIELVASLNADKDRYMEFACQPHFKAHAAERIYAYYEELERRLTDIIANI